MGKIKSFEDLNVWQKGKRLAVEIYGLTSKFPKEEIYGMTSQIRRASVSVPANLAEGFGRYHFMDKAKFYLNARGSLYELKSHLVIAKELAFIEDGKGDGIFHCIEELSLGINNLINSTRRMKKAEIGR